MNKSFLLLVFVAIVFNLNLQAQSDYQLSIGARLGSPIGLSAKYFLNESHAIEAYISRRSYSNVGSFTGLSGAYQVHKDLDIILEGLNWYFGAGASLYFWAFKDSFDLLNDNPSTAFGLQGYLGLDYKFANVPINLSLDWVPTIFLGNGYSNGFNADYGALSLRYVIR